jgi:hypothetical protein
MFVLIAEPNWRYTARRVHYLDSEVALELLSRRYDLEAFRDYLRSRPDPPLDFEEWILDPRFCPWGAYSVTEIPDDEIA